VLDLQLSAASLYYANLSNANLSNANLSNANLSNASVTDIDYTVTNTGNTTQAFDVRLLATAVTSPVQLIVSRTYTKPIANGCELVEQPDNKLVVNAGIVDPADPVSVGTQNPLATFPLAPGETIQVTLRSFSTIAEARTLATTVAPVVSPQGNPTATATALILATDPNPNLNPQVGVLYTLPLQAIGGTNVTLQVTGSTLPAGLVLESLGSNKFQITGTPTAAGSFPVTLEATDQSNPQELTQKDLVLQIGRGSTTLGLSASAATVHFGDAVTLTATVVPGSGPGGTVTFKDGANLVGNPVAVSGGTATLMTSGLGVGPHDLSATYGGDSNWAGTSSASVTVQVKVKTVLKLTTDPLPAVYGAPMSLVAFIDPIPAGAPPPTGQVVFSGDGVSGAGTFSGISAVLSFSAAGGTHLFNAAFAGDANYDGASVIDAPVIVSAARTSVDLVSGSSNSNPSSYGQVLTFVAQVTSSAGTPDGSVTFYDVFTPVGSDPQGPIALGSISLVGGSATLNATLLAGGMHVVSAHYEGSPGPPSAPNFGSSDSVLSVFQAVNPAVVTANLVSSLNPSRVGQAIAFTCTVSPAVGTPTGMVNLQEKVGATLLVLGTATLSAGGTATITLPSPGFAALAVGTHSLSCEYLGDGNFAATTSPALPQTVTSPATTTALTASPNPVREDKLVTFTATVTSTGGLPTGTVTFLDGSTAIGTATLTTLGKATLTRKPGQEGVHSITAVYGGSPSFAGSTSAAVALKVLEEYSCSAYKLPLLTGGTVSAPSKSGNFTFGTKVAVKWQFRKATGAYVSRPTAVKSLEAVSDALCNGKPSATATRIALFNPVAGPVTGSTFTYDTAANQYNLGWDTSKASKGCWDIVLTADNGVPQVATILTLK